MADLQTDVRYIKGIGEQRAKALARVGVTTLQELILVPRGGVATDPGETEDITVPPQGL